MNPRLTLFIVVSLALNCALVALLVTGRNPPSTTPAPPAPRTAPAVASAPAKIDPDVWPSLQADDLPTLVARLRAAGFPADVIRAIVSARLGEAFGLQRKALDPDEDTRPFWKTRVPDPKRDLALRQLGREHAKLLRDLLGDDAVADPMRNAFEQRRLVGLPPEKVGQVRQLLRDYDEKASEFFSAGMMTMDRDKMATLEKTHRAALAQLLTPAELADYELRNSNTARQLRGELAAFNTTEAEFRQIFQLKQPFDERFGGMFGFGSPSAADMSARREAQTQLTEQIKAALGPVRAEEYARATDYNYRQASQLVARLELPPGTTNQIWSVQKDIQQRTQALQADRTMPAEQRTQQLATLAEEAKAKITATLGARGFEAYKQYGGQWLQMLQPRTLPPGTTPGTIRTGP